MLGPRSAARKVSGVSFGTVRTGAVRSGRVLGPGTPCALVPFWPATPVPSAPAPGAPAPMVPVPAPPGPPPPVPVPARPAAGAPRRPDHGEAARVRERVSARHAAGGARIRVHPDDSAVTVEGVAVDDQDVAAPLDVDPPRAHERLSRRHHLHRAGAGVDADHAPAAEVVVSREHAAAVRYRDVARAGQRMPGGERDDGPRPGVDALDRPAAARPAVGDQQRPARLDGDAARLLEGAPGRRGADGARGQVHPQHAPGAAIGHIGHAAGDRHADRVVERAA
jgi:hypothetical protein